MNTEIPTQYAADIFKHLTVEGPLTLHGWQGAQPETKRLALDEAARLLKSGEVPRSNKDQLISYLQAIRLQPSAEAYVIAAIDVVLDRWFDAPL